MGRKKGGEATASPPTVYVASQMTMLKRRSVFARAE